MAPSRTIVVLGSLNVDLISRVSRIPYAGETITSTSFSTGCGGKGANQAVACARLSRIRDDTPAASHRVAKENPIVVKMIGAVGSDAFGKELKSSLEYNGVDTQHVIVTEKQNSGVATIIIDDSSGENRIILSPGANHTLKLDLSTTLSELKPDLLVLQMEIPLGIVEEAIRVAKKANILVLLNPAPAVALSESTLRDVNYLILNETELAILSGHSHEEQMDEFGIAEAAQRLCELGVEHVVVTLGAKGSLYRSGQSSGRSIPKAKVSAVDTTGAGDTYVGSFAVSIVHNMDLETQERFNFSAAMDRATNAAGITVQRRGAQDSIPWLDELQP